MRRAAYIALLLAIWLVSLAALALSLDGLLRASAVHARRPDQRRLLWGHQHGFFGRGDLRVEDHPGLPAELPVGATWVWRLGTRIPPLLRGCGPTAIAGFVVTIGVNAVNGVL